LGLFIVKRFVEAHGGSVDVKSEGRDKGSTFIFTLPRDLNAYDETTVIQKRPIKSSNHTGLPALALRAGNGGALNVIE
jgi:hypothetical protein